MLKADNIASIQQYFLAVGIALCLIIILIIRFFQLQILDYDQYSKKANTNRIRKVTTSAPTCIVIFASVTVNDQSSGKGRAPKEQSSSK